MTDNCAAAVVARVSSTLFGDFGEPTPFFGAYQGLVTGIPERSRWNVRCLGSIELGKGSTYECYGNYSLNWVTQRKENAEWYNATVNGRCEW